MMLVNSDKNINLHIVPDSKFIGPFILDIEALSIDENHLFIAISRWEDSESHFTFIDGKKVIYAPLDSESFKLTVGKLTRFKKIFIHWLLPNVESFVRSIPAGPLVCWCFWGEFDASFGPFSRYLRYENQSKEFALSSDINWRIITSQPLKLPYLPKFLRGGVRFFYSLIRWFKRVKSISRVDILLHWNEIDLQLLRIANISPFLKRHEFFYNVIDVTPSTNSDFVDKIWIDHELDGKTVLLLGHSAFPSGNHLDALDEVKEKITDECLRIISFLSYGDSVYREVVIAKGRKLFGSRFIPITTLLPVSEYYYLLSRISAAFLNHRYSEGAGNIFRILLEGKPLFLNPRSTILKMLSVDGVKVYDASTALSLNNISYISLESKNNNLKYISNKFSHNASIKNLQAFFDANN